MKNLKLLNVLLITIMISIFVLVQPVFAKSSGSTSSSSSSSSSSVSRTSGSGFKSGSFSSTSKNTSSNTNSTASKNSSNSNKSTSTTNTNSKSSSVTSSTKTVNTNSSALRSIPSSYSSHSVSNNYYYNVDNGGSSFWSNYWMYRALTPEHRTYIMSDGSSAIAPSYTGASSIIPDLITLFIIISIVGITIYIIKKRRERR